MTIVLIGSLKVKLSCCSLQLVVCTMVLCMDKVRNGKMVASMIVNVLMTTLVDTDVKKGQCFFLNLTIPITTAADNIFIFFLFFFMRK